MATCQPFLILTTDLGVHPNYHVPRGLLNLVVGAFLATFCPIHCDIGVDKFCRRSRFNMSETEWARRRAGFAFSVSAASPLEKKAWTKWKLIFLVASLLSLCTVMSLIMARGRLDTAGNWHEFCRSFCGLCVCCCCCCLPVASLTSDGQLHAVHYYGHLCTTNARHRIEVRIWNRTWNRELLLFLVGGRYMTWKFNIGKKLCLNRDLSTGHCNQISTHAVMGKNGNLFCYRFEVSFS